MCIITEQKHYFSKAKEIGEWCFYFYKKPQPEKLKSYIRFDKNNTEEDYIITVLVSQILKKYPEYFSVCLDALRIQDMSKVRGKAILKAIWLSDTEKGRESIRVLAIKGRTKFFRKIAKELIQKPLPTPLAIQELSEVTPDLINQCWGVFFATKNEDYLKKILFLYKKAYLAVQPLVQKSNTITHNIVDQDALNLGILARTQDTLVRFATGNKDIYRIVLSYALTQGEENRAVFDGLLKQMRRRFKQMMKEDKSSGSP
jgi:hypothetical protein